MTIEAQRKNRFPIREMFINGTVSAVFAVSGGALLAGAARDLFVNEIPAEHERSEILDERYPLIDTQTFQDSENNVLIFEAKVHDLIVKEQESEIPKLIEDSNMISDYKTIDQQKANLAKHHELDRLSDRHMRDIGLFVTGWVTFLGGSLGFLTQRSKRFRK